MNTLAHNTSAPGLSPIFAPASVSASSAPASASAPAPASILIDSHCHLEFPDFESDLEEVVLRAERAGVKGILTIGTYLSRFSQVLALAERFPALVCSVGVHPHHAEEEAALTSIERLVEWGRLPRVVGIGETGLDYHYDHSPRWRQEQSFRLHLRAAQEAGLPVIVHTREADEDTLRILREENQGQLTGVIHCFSGGPWLAEQALELGFFISVSGIASFKKADALRQTLTRVPLNRLLVETDAPYLAPMPYRGKRNEPAYVRHTAAALAQVKGVSLETLAAASRANFFRLFPKAELCWPKLVPEEKPQGE